MKLRTIVSFALFIVAACGTGGIASVDGGDGALSSSDASADASCDAPPLSETCVPYGDCCGIAEFGPKCLSQGTPVYAICALGHWCLAPIDAWPYSDPTACPADPPTPGTGCEWDGATRTGSYCQYFCNGNHPVQAMCTGGFWCGRTGETGCVLQVAPAEAGPPVDAAVE